MKRRPVTAKPRPWKRASTDPSGVGDVRVTIGNGTVDLIIAGPEAEVEQLVDRFLRELP